VELNFAVIDIVLALLILILAVRGTFRGFVAEIGSMAAVILGILGAVVFSKPLAGLLIRYIGESFWNQIIAFLVLFLGIYIAVKLIERILHSIFEKLELDKLDRVLGFFLGLAEGILFTCVILFLLSWQPFFDIQGLLRDSLFARVLFPLLPLSEGFLNSEPFLKNV
jgi:membrane protein required for colicin V production